MTPPLLLPAPPAHLSLPETGEGGAKKRLVAPSLSVTLSEGDPHAEALAALSASPSLDINLEALETPSGSESGTLAELEWEGEAGPRLTGPAPPAGQLAHALSRQMTSPRCSGAGPRPAAGRSPARL